MPNSSHCYQRSPMAFVCFIVFRQRFVNETFCMLCRRFAYDRRSTDHASRHLSRTRQEGQRCIKNKNVIEIHKVFFCLCCNLRLMYGTREPNFLLFCSCSIFRYLGQTISNRINTSSAARRRTRRCARGTLYCLMMIMI